MTEYNLYLSEQYNNSARVTDADALIDAYSADAAAFRETEGLIADYDLKYGTEARNLLDIFWPDESREAPISVFLHGGYWQQLDRSDFSHLAKGLLENGIAVAIPSYTLAPDRSISGIITEIRRACLLLHQTYKRPLTVFGHSAGGHLAACVFATDWAGLHSDLPDNLVQSGLGISGLYDLAPLVPTPINDALGLDEEAATASSPLTWLPPALQRFDAWVGGAESDEYLRQSASLSARWSLLGTPSKCEIVVGENHFTIVSALTDPESPMVQHLVGLVREPVTPITLPEPDEQAVLSAMQSGVTEPSNNATGEEDDQQERAAMPEEPQGAGNIPPQR